LRAFKETSLFRRGLGRTGDTGREQETKEQEG